MFGNFAPGACNDERGCRRNIKCMCAITTGAGSIIDGSLSISKFYFERIGAHGARGAADLWNGLAFHTQRDQICTDLRRCGLTGHDDVHGLFGLGRGQVTSIDGFGNEWFKHG